MLRYRHTFSLEIILILKQEINIDELKVILFDQIILHYLL
jgi:hypothetical protein